MESKIYVFIITALIVGIGLGFVLGTVFTNQRPGSERTQLSIGDVQWRIEGDILTMVIPITNKGTMPAAIKTISVRVDAAGSAEYADKNPLGLASNSDTVTAGGGDTFEWDAIHGSAPSGFLLPGNTYVIKVTVHDGYFEKTTTAPLEY